MAYRCEEKAKEPGRLSNNLRVHAGVSDPREVEEILNDEYSPEIDVEILKRRRAKKSKEGYGASAPKKLFGDGIKFDNSNYFEPYSANADPKLDFLRQPVSHNTFHLRNELSFDLDAVNRLKESQNAAQALGPVHDLQWLESKLKVP